jgi:hypothetical protein
VNNADNAPHPIALSPPPQLKGYIGGYHLQYLVTDLVEATLAMALSMQLKARLLSAHQLIDY